MRPPLIAASAIRHLGQSVFVTTVGPSRLRPPCALRLLTTLHVKTKENKVRRNELSKEEESSTNVT